MQRHYKANFGGFTVFFFEGSKVRYRGSVVVSRDLRWFKEIFEHIPEVSETMMCVTEGPRRFQGFSELFQEVSEAY